MFTTSKKKTQLCTNVMVAHDRRCNNSQYKLNLNRYLAVSYFDVQYQQPFEKKASGITTIRTELLSYYVP